MKLIDKIKEYNSKQTKEIQQILNPKDKYKINFIKKGKTKQMAITKDNTPIIIGDYNFYGIYQPDTHLWVWASSIPGVDRKHLKNIRKIKKAEHLFESDSDMNFYYTLLTQDVILIDDETMLDKLNHMLLYLSGDMFYFNPVNSDENIQFITLARINEKYK
jgi:outer membrane lipoprotein-sorting protein